MASTVGYDKQPSSRIVKIQNLTWLGSGTLATTNFTSETYQIRICSQIPIWFSVDNSTAAGPLLSTLPTTTGGVGTFLPNSTVGGEYFACSPGQILVVSSTSSSTLGTAGNFISIQEMA
jgi:hypothetical protein